MFFGGRQILGPRIKRLGELRTVPDSSQTGWTKSLRASCMDLLNREELEFLAQSRHRWCVSVFLPTHRAGKETLQDSVRFKNLLKEAESELLAGGVPKMKARELLAAARQLEGRASFWRQQSDGLALFLAPGFFQYFRLPLHFQELALLAEHFEIKPLLPLFTVGGRFYLLSLSQKQVRVFEGTQYGLRELDLQGIPRGIQETLKYDVREAQQQVHSGTGAPGAQGRRGAVFHGQAVGVDDAKERILQYFLQIDKGLRLLNGQHAPLILAGVKELFPIYRRANSYDHLLEDGVEGNPDLLSLDQLHRAALDTLERNSQRLRNQAAARYDHLAGSGRASNDLEEILRSVYQGRVAFALLSAGNERWGSFHPENGSLTTHESRQPGDEDLLNTVAIETVLHRGSLYAFPPQEMPGRSPVAAVFRY